MHKNTKLLQTLFNPLKHTSTTQKSHLNIYFYMHNGFTAT